MNNERTDLPLQLLKGLIYADNLLISIKVTLCLASIAVGSNM